jgi:hypothetical protein
MRYMPRAEIRAINGAHPCIILRGYVVNIRSDESKANMNALERSAKQERKLIKTEEKAEKRFLGAAKERDKAARKLSAADQSLQAAEADLRAAQAARAAGPEGKEKPADA